MEQESAIITGLEKIFNAPAGSITGETLLKEDLHVSSMTLFSVIVLLEDLTGKEVIFQDLNNCNTVADVIALVA